MAFVHKKESEEVIRVVSLQDVKRRRMHEKLSQKSSKFFVLKFCMTMDVWIGLPKPKAISMGSFFFQMGKKLLEEIGKRRCTDYKTYFTDLVESWLSNVLYSLIHSHSDVTRLLQCIVLTRP